MHGYALRPRRRSTGSAPSCDAKVHCSSAAAPRHCSVTNLSSGSESPAGYTTSGDVTVHSQPGWSSSSSRATHALDALRLRTHSASSSVLPEPAGADEGQRARSAPLEGIQEFQPVHEPRRRERLHACPRDRRRSWRLPAWDGKRTPAEPAPPYRSTGAGGHPKWVIPLVCPGCEVRPAAPPTEIADPSRPLAHHFRVWRSAARRRLLLRCEQAAVPEKAATGCESPRWDEVRRRLPPQSENVSHNGHGGCGVAAG
jgi:hypothetical protein